MWELEKTNCMPWINQESNPRSGVDFSPELWIAEPTWIMEMGNANQIGAR